MAVDGFGGHGVPAFADPLGEGFFGVVGGEADDGAGVAVLADLAEGLGAVEDGHVEVEQDEVIGGGGGAVEGERVLDCADGFGAVDDAGDLTAPARRRYSSTRRRMLGLSSARRM